MSYRDWHVGMKVVCVEDKADWVSLFDGGTSAALRFPKSNHVYTISRIIAQGSDVGIQVEEIATQYRDGSEIAFWAGCFRPVQPRATDISIFTAMLTGTKRKVDA